MRGSGVACFAIRAGGDPCVLLLRRSVGDFRGSWAPVAGRCEAGESPRAAVRRELVEETGLEAAEVEERWGGALRLGGGALRLHVFRAVVSARAEVRLNEEHDRFRWCCFEEACSLLPLTAQRRALADVMAPAGR